MLQLAQTSAEYAVRSKTLKQSPQDLGRFLTGRLPRMGPTYVKFGQWVSSRPDVFGPDLCQELSQLQDRVPPMSDAEVREVLHGSTLMQQVSYVDPSPLASASIAQVHRATLKRGGVSVVVKISRPDVLQAIRRDVRTIDRFLGALGAVRSEGIDEAKTLIRHFEDRLTIEVDLGREAAQLMRFREMYAHNPVLRVPRVYPELCSSRLLVMENVPTLRIEAVPNEHRERVAVMLMSSFMMQMLDGGLVHADPHAGNMGLHATTNQIVLYDFGNVIELSKEVQLALKEVLLLIMDRSIDEIIALFPKLGITVLQGDNLREYVSSYIDYIESLDPNTIMTSTAFSAPPPKGGRVPITVDVQLLSLLRIFSMLEGACKSLDPDFNYLSIWPVVLMHVSKEHDLMWARVRKDVARLFA